MRTSKPISTISFNSTQFLVVKLEELRLAGRISFWAFIAHLPEDDEGGKKEHHHLYVEPSKMLQTDDLRRELQEPDPASDRPRGTLTWQNSRFDAWYLYALHDRRYLAQKNQSRKHHYAHEEFISSDPDDLLAKSRSIDLISLSPYGDMLDAIENGLTWQEYFARGIVPLPQIRSFEHAGALLVASKTDRNGRDGHPDSPDTEPSTPPGEPDVFTDISDLDDLPDIPGWDLS